MCDSLERQTFFKPIQMTKPTIDNSIFELLIKTDLKANERMIEYEQDVISKEKDFVVRQALRQDLKELLIINHQIKAQLN